MAKLRCKAGDTAMMNAPHCYGRLVTVVRLYEPGEVVDGLLFRVGECRDFWVVRSLGTPIATLGLDDKPGARSTMNVVAHDSVLIPIRRTPTRAKECKEAQPC